MSLFPTDSLRKIVFLLVIIPLTLIPKKFPWRKFHTLWAAADIYAIFYIKKHRKYKAIKNILTKAMRLK